MKSVFVSHSVKDRRWREAFDTICARAGIRADCMEFEKLPSPPWLEIKKRIADSSAVFVLIGAKFPIGLLHTNNWIAFELGIASAMDKDVWVIEDIRQGKAFALPMLHNYVLCEQSWLEDIPPSPMFNFLRDVLVKYVGFLAPSKTDSLVQKLLKIRIATTGLPAIRNGVTLRPDEPVARPIKCSNPKCGINFNFYTNVSEFFCPSCRERLTSKPGGANV